MAAMMLSVGVAEAQSGQQSITIAQQPLPAALKEFGVKTGVPVLYGPGLAQAKTSPGARNAANPEAALRALLVGTGLTYRRNGAAFLIVQQGEPSAAPQIESAAGGAQPVLLEEVVVTAQKKEESIQEVPIAVSAFSAQALDDRKIEGGAELLRAIPNVSFSKGNFSMYNFSIRGIGTKAISAGSDPAVAVSFNNTPLIRNRLFEQEFLDVERVEVLRGPQGTLYGRNATAGVVNMIPKLPSGNLEATIKGELGNYDTRRLSGMINLPLGDTFAVRLAGGMTQRSGFDYNTFTKQDVNDRDLWSTRLSAKWDPTGRFTASAIWEHFEENDQRARTGKQLCNRDNGPANIRTAIPSDLVRARLSQGCLAGSLFQDEAYGVPNGLSFPQFLILDAVAYGFLPGQPPSQDTVIRALKDRYTDPFRGLTQSKDLREINTSYDPIFRAKNDVFQLNLAFDLTDNLQLISQSAYSEDRYYSSQDYNRFVSNPIFSDSSQAMIDIFEAPLAPSLAAPGGFYNDPQLGPSDRMLAVDLSKSSNRQWSQELRLQSSFDGPFNFSLGANYLKFKSQDDYYVFNNTFSMLAEYFYNQDLSAPVATTQPCTPTTPQECVYVDPNRLNSINGEGHNYFRSKNVVQTESWAIFGETYWEVTEKVKITAGLRYTDDSKTSTPYPSQLLLGSDQGAPGQSTGGKVSTGYPALPDIKQGWDEFTGRFVIDWKPTLSFSDETMLYASYARGYKGGGANPPRVDIDTSVVQYQPLPTTFRPEYVNAFEVGAKNTFMNGALRANATAFYYDYKDYQVSQIVDRISLNENFDARNMGAELEVIWRPIPDLRLDANIGYLHTELGKGAKSIDVMDRTQGHEDWTLVRPWVQVPSNCIAPTAHVEKIINTGFDDFITAQALSALCAGAARVGSFDPAFPSNYPFWLFYGITYNPLNDAPNGGRGFYADLGGNELPNAPNWTLNFAAQYTFNINAWRLTVRGDYYRQSESYARVYNTTYDRLKAWDNTNLSATLDNPNSKMVVQIYVKNVFDKTPITDFFTNSDDTGLTANVFTLDPRIFGVSITGRF
jgi:outer membrane receptor protein involved in Fe transport